MLSPHPRQLCGDVQSGFRLRTRYRFSRSVVEIDENMMERYVGRDYESSALDVVTMYPTQESWAQNDREVVCALYDMSGEKLVGSVKGTGI